MDGSPYQVVYDITKTSPPIHEILTWLEGLAIGIFIITSVIIFIRNRHLRKPALIFGCIWIIMWLGLGGLGFGNVIYQYYTCVDWVKTGNYSIVTGNVSEFNPMPYGGHKNESFSVNGVHFEYSDYDLSKCGFNNSTSHGGPIVEGLPVRISYRAGSILILETKK